MALDGTEFLLFTGRKKPNPNTIFAASGKLKRWLGDSMSMGIGTKVAQLIDKSGNGNHASQGTFANQPTRVENALGNVVATRFTTSQILVPTATSGIVIGDKPEAWLVYKQLSTSGVFGYPFGFEFSTMWWNTQRAGAAPSKNFDCGPSRLTFTDASDDSFELLRFRLTPTQSVDRNGVQIGTNANTPSITGNPSNAGYIGNQFAGDICELFVLSSAPSASEKTAFLTWLAAKYPSLSIVIS